jgi:general secretion pathway protein N
MRLAMSQRLRQRLRRPLLGGLLLLALSCAYLVMLPATWFDSLLQSGSQGTLAMTGTKGTLWRGEGSLQALLPSGEVVTLAPVAWDVALAELLSLQLHVTVRSTQDGKPVLDAAMKPGESRIHAARLQLPAALLGVLSPTLRAADLSGQLSLVVNDVRLGGGHATGSAQVLWQAAGSGLSRIRPLGSYQLALNGQGSSLDFRLLTLGGPLNLDGSGQWTPNQKTVYHITATPTEATRKDLAPLLRMLGREISPGSYQLTIDQNVGAVSG